MRSQTGFVADRLLGKATMLSLAGLLTFTFAAPLSAQDCPVNSGVHTICRQIGNAEAVSVTSPFGAYPTLQPTVYWHDDEWKIDMLPQSSPIGELTMSLTSKDGITKSVKFPAVLLVQVDSIIRSPGDKAIILGEANGTSLVFSIVDLNLAKIVDGSLIYHPSISPNRRFLIYNNWYQPHLGGENLFTLYDTLKSAAENTCGYGESNPLYKRNADALGGIQVYPAQSSCLDGPDDGDDNQDASDFLWSSDSSRVVFADVKSSILSLVLVTMPVGAKEHPKTEVYSFVGAENICSGSATCGYKNLSSLAFTAGAVKATLVGVDSSGKPVEKNLTVPFSKFSPI